jgi:hypothetical protein
MYLNPFDPATGTAAAEVWGQDSFDGGLCNKGNGAVHTISSLCMPNAVDLDTGGNLWVADGGWNNRVLRFPRDPTSGVIAKSADIDIGGFSNPMSVRVRQGGDVYVDDYSGVWRISNPQVGGVNTPQNLAYISNDPDRDKYTPTQMAFDPNQPTHLWVVLSHETEALYDVAARKFLRKLQATIIHSVVVSQGGDVFTLDSSSGLYRLAPGEQPGQWTPGDLAFLSGGGVTLDSLSVVTGITTAGNQLLVADREGVLFWDDYHAITEGQEITRPADGMWTGASGPYFVKSDTGGRIWIGDWVGTPTDLSGSAHRERDPGQDHFRRHVQGPDRCHRTVTGGCPARLDLAIPASWVRRSGMGHGYTGWPPRPARDQHRWFGSANAAPLHRHRPRAE